MIIHAMYLKNKRNQKKERLKWLVWISFVKIGVVDNHLNMIQLLMELKHVKIILEDMNLDLNMVYGQNVGHVVVKNGKLKAVN